MSRMAMVCTLLALFPGVGRAEDPPKPTETLIHLTVQPMAAPKPALRFQLLPELKEMNPGNPILDYLKCFAEQQNFFHSKAEVDKREKWLAAGLADLPVKELHDYGRGPLTRAGDAARLDNPDWQILSKAKKEGLFLLLPEVQGLRNLASCLQLRFRVQVAERDFDEAIVTAKTMFALSRHLGEHPTLIGDLVGLAIANLAIRPLDEMIGQPGCPNLYWALTDLPTPFIDLRKGLQGERLLMEPIFAGIDTGARMPDATLEKVVSEIEKAMKGLDITKKDTRAWLDTRAKDANYVTSARKRLVESGLDEKAVEAFAALQVIILDEKREFEVRRDDSTKWLALPYWKAEPGLTDGAAVRSKDDTLFNEFISAVVKVKRAQARVDQRIALLRHVEALRMYAADHDGKLPAKLDDVKLPLPVDPFTGKPFSYEFDGTTAIVKGTAPKGEETNAAYNVRYAVTIKK
jgi:hypothetical protein